MDSKEEIVEAQGTDARQNSILPPVSKGEMNIDISSPAHASHKQLEPIHDVFSKEMTK